MNGIKNALIPIFLKYGLNKGYILAVFRTTVTAISKKIQNRMNEIYPRLKWTGFLGPVTVDWGVWQ